MEIIRLRRDYQILEKKNKELLTKVDELTKKNNLISKENISLKYSHPEKNKKIKEITDIIEISCVLFNLICFTKKYFNI